MTESRRGRVKWGGEVEGSGVVVRAGEGIEFERRLDMNLRDSVEVNDEANDGVEF